ANRHVLPSVPKKVQFQFMARIHPPLENWRRVSGEIRTEPLISSGNIRRLQREERPRGDPAGRSLRRLPSRPRKAKYISGVVYQHTLRHTDLALRKPKKAYKNRVLKILVPLRYREKLDTNPFSIFVLTCLITCYTINMFL